MNLILRNSVDLMRKSKSKLKWDKSDDKCNAVLTHGYIYKRTCVCLYCVYM